MAEKLSLNHRLRKSSHTDGYQRPFTALTQSVNTLGQQFLANTRFADEYDIEVGFSYLDHLPQHRGHSRICCDHVRKMRSDPIARSHMQMYSERRTVNRWQPPLIEQY